MILPRYEMESTPDMMTFEFISVGNKGEIPKVVLYTEIHANVLYNLGLGDKNLETGEIDDTVISNNGDSREVLATVAASVYAFTERYPNAWIYATGSTKSRTRLYRMGLTVHFDAISQDFEIYGQKGGEWQRFVKGVEYEAFLARRRSETNGNNRRTEAIESANCEN